MSAGLPGLGLGGLFFILSALLAPVFELLRAARGESSPDRWRQVARQFALAALMIAAVELTLRGVYLVLAAAGSGEGRFGATALPLAPIAVTGALLGLVLIAAKGVELALRTRRVPVPRTTRLPASRWAVVGLAGIAAASIGLIAFGASEYGTLSNQDLPAEVRVQVPPGAVRAPAAAIPFKADADTRAIDKPAAGATSPDTPSQSPDVSSAPFEPGAQTGGEPAVTRPEPPASPGGTPGGDAPPTGPDPPSGSPGPPENAGPPASAGPPAHSQAPPSAGPPAHAGPNRDSSQPR